jgi:DNA topoisomerase-1
VRNPADLKRIRALAIPPAWKDVWICSDPKGHLQATGRDARGRKELFQYLDDDGRAQDVNSSDVNQYLRDITGMDVTAKDFRSTRAKTERRKAA